ncbi:sarcosine oxidase subunit gamma family protein [Aquamicrobium sp. LC103]|uniref:sarcosine oxidase subunit gamma n=1 Tax=Aquamicrobium sp. LC103 TaxID=1120658 RepID=UPI00069AC34F|nr:sarcosine oxidase subunit gamma family protein [Aquamicrobium sp. LC103]
MPDPTAAAFELTHRPVLVPVALTSPCIALLPLPEGTVIQILGPAARVEDVCAITDATGFSLRGNGPGQWFAVGDEPDKFAELAATLPDGFTAIDQSHGRVRIAIEGESVGEVLAKGTGVDLALFETGRAATTLIGHVATHLARISDDRFELLVTRSFAENVWDDLKIMAAEYLGVSHE